MADKDRANLTRLSKAKGKPGESLIQAFTKEEQKADTLRIQDYRRMLNDGQVSMLWNAITSIILSAGISIQEDPDWDREEESQEKQFIERNLLTPRWKGGMSTNIEDVLRVQLRALIEGYRIFELVYRAEDGKIKLDKMAPRSGIDDSEMKIIADDNGDYKGFHQKLTFAGKSVDVTVTNDGEVLKTIKSTYGSEFGSLYGKAAFKSIWYHYDKAHKGMYLNHVGHELGVIGYRVFRAKKHLGETRTDAILDVLSRPHVESAVVLPESDGELVVEKLTDSGVMKEGKEMIDFHYGTMAKALLAQFVDLGTTKSGNRALGESQIDFFKEGLQSVATILIEKPWNAVIASLIRMNFNSGVYPMFKVGEIEDESAELLHEAFIELTKSGELPNSVKDEIIAESATNVGLDVNKEEIEQERKEQEAQREQEKQEMQAQQRRQQVETELSDVELQEGFTRPLFPDEEKVRLLPMARKMEEARMNAFAIMERSLLEQKDEIIDKYLSQLNGRRKSVKIELADPNQMTYSEELEMLAIELMDFGKTMAANELNVGVPTTKKKDRQKLIDSIMLILDDQASRLGFRLQGVLDKSKAAGLPENDTRELLEQEYDGFWRTALRPTLAATIPQAMNFGRDITFRKEQDNIWAYRYTAVLDDNTTNYCRKLDGTVMQPTDPNFYKVSPPNHFGCRSVWTPITSDERDQYGLKVEGKPSDLPTHSSISSFVDLEAIEDEINSILATENGEHNHTN